MAELIVGLDQAAFLHRIISAVEALYPDKSVPVIIDLLKLRFYLADAPEAVVCNFSEIIEALLRSCSRPVHSNQRILLKSDERGLYFTLSPWSEGSGVESEETWAEIEDLLSRSQEWIDLTSSGVYTRVNSPQIRRMIESGQFDTEFWPLITRYFIQKSKLRLLPLADLCHLKVVYRDTVSDDYRRLYAIHQTTGRPATIEEFAKIMQFVWQDKINHNRSLFYSEINLRTMRDWLMEESRYKDLFGDIVDWKPVDIERCFFRAAAMFGLHSLSPCPHDYQLTSFSLSFRW